MTTNIPIECWLNVLCTTAAPGRPFSTPLLVLFDSIRLIVLILCVINLVLTTVHFDKLSAPGQRNRMLSGVLWTLQTLTTESIHLGDQATMRLIFNSLATVAFFYGLWQVHTAARSVPIES